MDHLVSVYLSVMSRILHPQSMASKEIARLLRKQSTWAERLLWKWLRQRRFSVYKFRRQHPFGPYILDFFCPEAMVDIELDGSQHGAPENRQNNADRDAWLQKRGIKVLRFWNGRLRREKQVIRDTIWQVLQERALRPAPDCWESDSLEKEDEKLT